MMARLLPLDALAEYLTGPEVLHHSIALDAQAESLRVRAQQFFALREAFNVRGYATAAEARQQIGRAIGEVM